MRGNDPNTTFSGAKTIYKKLNHATLSPPGRNPGPSQDATTAFGTFSSGLLVAHFHRFRQISNIIRMVNIFSQVIFQPPIVVFTILPFYLSKNAFTNITIRPLGTFFHKTHLSFIGVRESLCRTLLRDNRRCATSLYKCNSDQHPEQHDFQVSHRSTSGKITLRHIWQRAT